jgi:lipase maturation factor 1
MDLGSASFFRRWFDPECGAADRLIPRWLFLRALGLIYFSAFFSLVFQIRGLIGAHGILPSNEYLEAIAQHFGVVRYWFAPTLLWFSTGPHMLNAICWAGMIASLLVVFNLCPRATLFICLGCFLSFVSAAQDFSGYQSDGMLLEAGFISLFFAPRGFFPGLGKTNPPSRAALFLLQWEWFRIYFESGMVKLASGDVEWRNFTAMDEYYQNGPLPTWIGWYMQHLPHWFHAFATGATLALELGLVFMLFLPRRWRIVCFFIVTAWQIPVILTANYTFLNYLVLVLGFLLLDDRFLLRIMPERWRAYIAPRIGAPPEKNVDSQDPDSLLPRQKSLRPLQVLRLSLVSVMLIWIFYNTTAQMIWILSPRLPLPTSPVAALEPFRIANRYGLFAVMTRGRYEIEFQGSNDGQTWIAYPFRYKPQDPSQRPGIYAPYQPRFDWNLWFASLGSWRENLIVPSTEERLLAGSPDVLDLFAGNAFPQAPPLQLRAVLWQYWFTTLQEKRATGMWWKRKLIGLYAPVLVRLKDGKIGIRQYPEPLPPRE